MSELCDLDRDLTLSIDIPPVPTDEAARQLQSTAGRGKRTLSTAGSAARTPTTIFTATIPYDMELQRARKTKEMLDDLTTRDQRMMFGLVTLVHLADSKQQLTARHRNALLQSAQNTCVGFHAALAAEGRAGHGAAHGLRKIQALRTLTTESTAVLIPFRAWKSCSRTVYTTEENAVSKNMIVADRRFHAERQQFSFGACLVPARA